MSLNVNAKAWVPGGGAKPVVPAAPVASPQVQNRNSAPVQASPQQNGAAFNPMAAQFTPSVVPAQVPGALMGPGQVSVMPPHLAQLQPYFDPTYGLVIPPFVPQMMSNPQTGELIQVMVPNPYYNIQMGQAQLQYQQQMAAQAQQVGGNGAANGFGFQVAEEGATAIEGTAEGESAPVEGETAVSTNAAPAVEEAKPAATTAAAAPVVVKEAPVTAKKEEKPAASATPAKVSSFAAAAAAYAAPKTEVPSSSSGPKHTYDKAALIALFAKPYVVSDRLKDVYGTLTNVQREPIGFYFTANMPRSSASSSNLSAHGSSGNLNKQIERGAKVPGRERKSGNPAFRERQERAEREAELEELYYADPSAPITPIDGPTYTSIFKAAEKDDVETTVRKANFILNKLSVTKFEKLSDEFMAEGLLESYDLIKRAVDLIVMKAQMEEHFCFMYADLCKKITLSGTAIMSEDSATSPVSEEAASGAASPAVDEDGAPAAKGPKTMGEIFRQLLLERCQFEFEHDRVEALEAIRNAEGLSPEEKAEKEQNLKKRYTGTMRFIGELFVKDLIRANIMTSCLEILLQSTEEEELTCMSKLFVTIGAQLGNYYLEKARATKTKSKRAKYLEAVPQYFVKVEELALNHPSSRVRYMLKDLIDLRANSWIPRRETDKVVDLSESRGVSHSNSSSNVEGLKGSNDARNMGAAPAVSDEWTTVTSVKGKTASSSNLTQLSTSNLGVRSGPSSGNKFVAKGGSSGLARSASHSNVGSAASGPSPKGGAAGWDKKKSASVAGQGLSINPNAGGKPGSRPPVSPMPQTTTVSGGVAAAKSLATVAEQPAVAPGPFDKESASWKRIKSTVEEYFSHKLVDEVTLVLSELSVPASHMPEIIKYLIIGSLEKKAEDRSALAKLIIALSSGADGKAAILTKTGVTAGVLLFLSEYDDVVIDVPLAGAYGAGIVGELIAADILSLSLFVDLPEDNNFGISTRAADFILQTLAAIAAASSAENAKTLFAASGIQLLPLINAPPRQSKEDVLAELVNKFNVSMII